MIRLRYYYFPRAFIFRRRRGLFAPGGSGNGIDGDKALMTSAKRSKTVNISNRQIAEETGADGSFRF